MIKFLIKLINLMKLINISINEYFHMIPLWKAPIKLSLWSYPWSYPTHVGGDGYKTPKATRGPTRGATQTNNTNSVALYSNLLLCVCVFLDHLFFSVTRG